MSTYKLVYNRQLRINDLQEYDCDLLITREFLLDTEEVINNINALTNLGFNALLTPKNKTAWGIIKQECDNLGLNTESILDLHEIPQSISFWFSNNQTYVFPKNWDFNGIHEIPGTSIGVLICGEINYVNEPPKNSRIILNPSLENNDLYIRGRTMMMAGKTLNEITQNPNDKQYSFINPSIMSMDEFLNQQLSIINKYLENDIQLFNNGLINHYNNINELINKYAKEKESLIAELNTRYNNYVNSIITNSEKKNNYTKEKLKQEHSHYFDRLSKKGINQPVIRCDNMNSTGLLNQHPVINAEYTDNECTLEIIIK